MSWKRTLDDNVALLDRLRGAMLQLNLFTFEEVSVHPASVLVVNPSRSTVFRLLCLWRHTV